MRRIAVMGGGSAGRRHIGLARYFFPKADIRVYRPSGSRDVPFGANQLLMSFNEIRSFEPELVVVAMPSTHRTHALSLIESLGAHVLFEKPLADRLSIVQTAMTQSLRDHVALVGYNLRYMQSYAMFKDALSHGVVGRPLFFQAEAGMWLPEWRPGSDYRSSVTARSELGGGVLAELSHEINYVLDLFGCPSRVSADLHWSGVLETDTEDLAHIVFRGTSGRSMTEAVGGVLSLDMLRRTPSRECRVIGSEGTLQWDVLRGRLTHVDAEQVNTVLVDIGEKDLSGSYTAMWRHFLSCITNGDEVLTSIEDGLRTLAVLDACQTSSASGVATSPGSCHD